MKLRSGKILLPPLCKLCKKFYGRSSWNWKCSNCNGHIQVSLFHTKEFQEKLQIWVENHIADDEHLGVLKWSTKYGCKTEAALMGSVLVKFTKDKKYITAAFAEELLRNCGIDSIKKSHLVCPFIIDWWNMRKYNFKPHELCYYGRYGDDPAQYINSIPPPMPNPHL
jgi:predicted amidophosphoribosyltransferase